MFERFANAVRRNFLLEQKLIVGFEQFVKEILSKQDETILEVGDFVSNIQSWGYEVME
jgi:hypothetical protein